MTARAEELAQPRILAGVAGDLEIVLTVDGTITDPTVAGTCTVTDEAGDTIASGAASSVGTSSGKLRFSLTAAQNAYPKRLIATWAAFTLGGVSMSMTSRHETVGEVLFTENEARTFDNNALTSTTTYPQATLLRGRDLIQDAFERILGWSMGTRYEREVVDGPGSSELWMDRREMTAVRSVKERTRGTSTWTAYSAADLADILVYRDGRLLRETLGSFAYGKKNVAIEYEHGRRPIPLDLRRAGLRLLRHQLVKSNLDDRALSQSGEFGTFSLATPGLRGAWFGIPQVDSVLDQLKAVVVA